MSLIAQQNKQKSVGFRVATLASVMLGAAVTLTACGGGDHEEVKAVDKVEEAAEMARANAPEAEVLEFDDAETATDADATATEGDVEAEGEDATAADATADTTAETDTAAVTTDTAATTDAEEPATEEADAQ